MNQRLKKYKDFGIKGSVLYFHLGKDGIQADMNWSEIARDAACGGG